MTIGEFRELRRALGLTQSGMARRMGLTLRTLQDIETGKSPLRMRHELLAERVAFEIAVQNKEPMLAPQNIRAMALDLAKLIRGA
ncbi:MAG: helix-turn-helix transcriptional regulator [Hyphomicrobiales bacterium]|nr:helix-turn-helix transcriptional regulator [Hyphomicrobiales bacterium]